MFSTADKTTQTTTTVHKKAQQQTFFRKAGEESFFGNNEKSSFFSVPVQAKLEVSSPDDPQEREADTVADKVMRMAEPVSSPVKKDEEKLQRKEEDEIQAKQISPVIQCKETATDDDKVLTKRFDTIQRSEKNAEEFSTDSETGSSDVNTIQRKNISLYHSDVIQRSGRGPPVSAISFEQSLTSSKGGGSSLPDATRQSMESRFNADFSGVRIHTGTTAEKLSSGINAQAFTHGNDIYFNSGKFSPDTATGGTLLAHELTHTIQQGASKSNVSSKSSSQVQKKNQADLKTKIQPKSGIDVLLVNKAASDNTQIQPGLFSSANSSGFDLSSKSGGSALTESAREYLEDYYHRDLSDIRVHTDREALEICISQGAVAFTQGKNICILPAKYDPESESGAILLSQQIAVSLKQRGYNTTNTGSESMSLIDQIKAIVNEISNPVEKQQSNKKEVKALEIPEKTIGAPKTKVSKGQKTTGKKKARRKSKYGDDTSVKSVKKNPQKSPSKPEEDPAFQKALKKTKVTSKNQRSHDDAEKKAIDAQSAAIAVPNEAESKSKNRKTDGMGEASQKDTPFDALSFKNDLLKKIEEITPKNLKEATEFKANNKIEQVKEVMGNKVASEKENSVGPVDVATAAPLVVNQADNKTPIPLPPTIKGNKPGGIGAKDAVPKNKYEAEISMAEQSKAMDEEMKANNVTENQLKSANEPSFAKALDKKRSAEADAVQKPKEYKKDEALILKEATANASGKSAQALNGMFVSRGKNFDSTVSEQKSSKQKDEDKRATVAREIERIYGVAEEKVKSELALADTESNEIFDAGSNAAKTMFENYVDEKMTAYKIKRYSGFWGGLRWAKDKLFGMPDAVNKFYTDGRKLYLDKMDEVITSVAATVTKHLNEAKNAISAGKTEIDDYVNKQPKALADFAKEAAANIQDKFDTLEQSVDDKKDALIDGLAKKYVENVKQLDDRINELKEANKGLIDKAIGFLKKVWQVIKDLTNLFLTILARLASIIGLILSNPGGFFSNLGRAFNQGFNRFKDRFTEHLERGLMEWLGTNLGIVGLEIPEKFDVAAFFSMALQVMGITKAHIRERAVVLIGERKVLLLEKSGGILYRIYNEGFGVLWDMIYEKLTDFKEIIWEAIKSFIQKKIIEEAIKFVLSMLSPIGAFVKVCMAIYNFLMTLVKFKDRIIELLDTILNAVMDIASGAVDAAAVSIEKALSKSISIIIAFLAAVLNLNNIAGKIKEIIIKVQKRVEKGIDFVIKKADALIGKVLDGALNTIDKGKAIVEKGKQVVVNASNKILGWIGFKKHFTTKDGKGHNIYTEGEGGAAEIIVASTPKTIEQLVSDRKHELETENKTTPTKIAENGPKLLALDAIVKIKKAIDPNLKKYGEAVDNKSDAQANDLKEKINKQMDSILEKLIICGINAEGANNIETKVAHKLTTLNRPASVTAFPLTKIPGNTAGSTPQERPIGWDYIPASANPSSNWVGAHLLNHHLHGPGVAWNMVCGTKETNNNMKTEVENTAKKAVLNNTGKQYYFEVNVHYYEAQPARDGKPAFPELVYFPKKIETEFGELEGVNGNFKKSTIIASRPFSQDTPSQTQTAIASFNESTATRLYEAAKDANKPVSKDIMSLIVTARKSLPTQSFGNSVANMIAIVDEFAQKTNGKSKDWFKNTFGTVLTELSHNFIFMEY